jgi:oligoribonuclease
MLVMDKNAPADVIVWIDCEMTGLESDDELVEIAVVPTDGQLYYLDNTNPDHGIDIIIKPTENGFARLAANDFVTKMHTKSGLINELEGGEDLTEVEKTVLKYVKKFEKKKQRALLGGNSVHADKKFLDKYMPNLSAYLHYRLVDVSTIKELSKVWYPKVYKNAPSKETNHRALDDIIESIEELRYYREKVFV